MTLPTPSIVVAWYETAPRETRMYGPVQILTFEVMPLIERRGDTAIKVRRMLHLDPWYNRRAAGEAANRAFEAPIHVGQTGLTCPHTLRSGKAHHYWVPDKTSDDSVDLV